MNILDEFPEYKSFFYNPEDDVPEIKTFDKITSSEDWVKNLSLTSKIYFARILDFWLSQNLIKANIQSRLEIGFTGQWQRVHSILTMKQQGESKNQMLLDIEHIKQVISSLLTRQEKLDYLNKLNKDFINYYIQSGIDVVKEKPLVLRFIQNEIDFLTKDSEGQMKYQATKLKWKCSIAVLGYLFIELVKQDYIETPVHNGDPNFAGFAKILWEHFDFEKKTTLEYFIKQFSPTSNSLSDTKREKFTIPDLEGLA